MHIFDQQEPLRVCQKQIESMIASLVRRDVCNKTGLDVFAVHDMPSSSILAKGWLTVLMISLKLEEGFQSTFRSKYIYLLLYVYVIIYSFIYIVANSPSDKNKWFAQNSLLKFCSYLQTSCNLHAIFMHSPPPFSQVFPDNTCFSSCLSLPVYIAEIDSLAIHRDFLHHNEVTLWTSPTSWSISCPVSFSSSA